MSDRPEYRLYSPDEDAVIVRGYRASKGPKVIARELAGRSQGGIQKRARVLGLTGKGLAPRGSHLTWAPGEIARFLDESGPMTPYEIVAATGVSLAHVYVVLKEGHGTLFHIGGWMRRPTNWAKRWAAGPGPDVPNYERKTVRECARIRQRRARRRAKFNPFESLIP
ncbi:hypothetical protein [Burkholderia cepacia]|uniref:hypothetical protein n=1 Tax=Burkholderia cepacia TaxID=292 RepID=UPI001F3B9941|nr:hypothetical protein [Burkholderia cepacia]MCE4125789.1 hypothetical protein [Burkholderia cepacia]